MIEITKKKLAKEDLYDQFLDIEEYLISLLTYMSPDSFNSLKEELFDGDKKYLSEELLWIIFKRNPSFFIVIKDK